MDVRFNDTRAANASAAKLWEVVTDYASYPTFNSAIINVRVADLLTRLQLFVCGRLSNDADRSSSSRFATFTAISSASNGHVHRHLRSGLRRWLRRKEPQQGVDDHQQQHEIRRDPHIVLGNHLQPVPDAVPRRRVSISAGSRFWSRASSTTSVSRCISSSVGGVVNTSHANWASTGRGGIINRRRCMFPWMMSQLRCAPAERRPHG
jgi:hypothetical protein